MLGDRAFPLRWAPVGAGLCQSCVVLGVRVFLGKTFQPGNKSLVLAQGVGAQAAPGSSLPPLLLEQPNPLGEAKPVDLHSRQMPLLVWHNQFPLAELDLGVWLH